ncbi:MAG TPA: hypothetical protein VI306_25095 [Pyrinomonadaceae bacterium]
MIGLMQIMIYMLSLYLVFKGTEILQIALMSNRNQRGIGIAIGIVFVMIALIAAIGFSFWADMTAAAISDRMNSIPGVSR